VTPGRLALLCFPYAGAGASIYRRWSSGLPYGVELKPIELPGHGRRLGEVAPRKLGLLVKELVEELLPRLRGPYVCFGHSFGAVLAYELAREMVRRQRPPPRALLLAGAEPPHRASRFPGLHALPEDRLLERLWRMATPNAGLLESPELRELWLPVLRSDLALLAEHVHEPEPVLELPFALFGGRYDPVAPRVQLAAWSELTRAPVRLRQLPGGHFFLHESRGALLEAIGEELKRVCWEAP